MWNEDKIIGIFRGGGERLDGYRISKSRKIKDIEIILQILKLKNRKDIEIKKIYQE